MQVACKWTNKQEKYLYKKKESSNMQILQIQIMVCGVSQSDCVNVQACPGHFVSQWLKDVSKKYVNIT